MKRMAWMVWMKWIMEIPQIFSSFALKQSAGSVFPLAAPVTFNT